MPSEIGITDAFIDPQLLHSLEEDDRSVPESPVFSADKTTEPPEKGKDAVTHSPIRSVTAPTSPLPVSASPITNSKFISPRNDAKIKIMPVKVCPYFIFFFIFSILYNGKIILKLFWIITYSMW